MSGKIQAKIALDYILAGRSTVTLVSKGTGTRFTYRVNRPDSTKPHFVRLLNGPDNTRNYSYMGRIVGGSQYIHDKRNRAGSADSPAAKGFRYVLYKLQAGEFDLVDQQVEIWHAGKCGRCGRKLTVPESIETGIGPVCSGKAQPASRNRNVIRNAKPIQAKAKSHKIGTIREVETGYEIDVISGYSSAIYTVQVAKNGSAVCNCEWADYRPGEDKRTGCSHSIAALDAIEQIVANRKLSVWTDEQDAARQHRPARHVGDGVVVTSRLVTPEMEQDAAYKAEFAAQEIAQDQAAFEAKMDREMSMVARMKARTVAA